MNRQDFLLKIQEFFGDLSAGLISGYKSVLNDPNGAEINYDMLYQIFLNEYKYRTAPMPAWFAEKLTQVRKYRNEQEGALDRDLKSGKLKKISYDPITTKTVYELPNGVIQDAYEKIVEDKAEPRKMG